MYSLVSFCKYYDAKLLIIAKTLIFNLGDTRENLEQTAFRNNI